MINKSKLSIAVALLASMNTVNANTDGSANATGTDNSVSVSHEDGVEVPVEGVDVSNEIRTLLEELLAVDRAARQNTTLGTIRDYEAELALQGTYRLNKDLTGLKMAGETTTAPTMIRGSKFTFVTKKETQDGKSSYWISPDCTWVPLAEGECLAADDEDAPINGTVIEVSDEQLHDASFNLSRALVHGVLLAPFKIRTEDKSLTGQSTLGYYFGMRSDSALVNMTPFFSAGLSFVNGVDEENPEENVTAFSSSIGLSFETKTNFQFAVMYGFDHVGGELGEKWIYEDDPWFSVGLGYDFLTN